jgi:hypothetical protein
MTQRRLARAEFEREKLLQAYFADALPLDQFKREQTRIAAEIDGAQAELAKAEAADSPYQSMLETALSYIRDARTGYQNADPYTGPGAYAHFPAGKPMLHQATEKEPCLFVAIFHRPFDVEDVS